MQDEVFKTHLLMILQGLDSIITWATIDNPDLQELLLQKDLLIQRLGYRMRIPDLDTIPRLRDIYIKNKILSKINKNNESESRVLGC